MTIPEDPKDGKNDENPTRKRENFQNSAYKEIPTEQDTRGFESSLEISRASNASSTAFRGRRISVVDKKEITAFCNSHNRRRIIMLINMLVVEFFAGVLYSMIAPFYPTEAAKKGATALDVGIVLGGFQIMVVIFSPIFGKYVHKIGCRFMYASGIIVAGGCAILFGFVEDMPAGAVFVTMSVIIRLVEGMGQAAYVTSIFINVLTFFPDHINVAFGLVETCSGIGLMIGPTIGGALFQAGGFKLPFIVVGSSVIIIGSSILCIFPREFEQANYESKSVLGLLKTPLVCLMLTIAFNCAAVIGAVETVFASYLQIFGLSPVEIGLLFLAGPAGYILFTPIWGYFTDKYPKIIPILLPTLYLLAGVSNFFLGPAPFLNIPEKQLWRVIICCIGFGVGFSAVVVTFSVMLAAAKQKGFKDDIGTHGLLSGFFTCIYSFGGFIGPIITGALYDSYGFGWTMTVWSFVTFAVVIVFSIYWGCCGDKKIFEKQTDENEQPDETTPLLTENGIIKHKTSGV